jgi:hypothetical protein
MDVNIGQTCFLSIGSTYGLLCEPFSMRKKIEGTVWARVKEALQDAGLPATQTNAARIAQIEQPSVSLWNKPNKFPEIESAVAIAQRTGVCVEWLFTGRGPKYAVPADQTAAQLWRYWPHLTPEIRGMLVGIASQNLLPAPESEAKEGLQRRSS